MGLWDIIAFVSLCIIAQDGYEKERTANTNWCHLGPLTGTKFFILAALIRKIPIRWKKRRESVGEGSIIYQKQRENIDIDREDGGGRAIRWCLALGIRKYRMWHLHVRRLWQTTVRAHVILTQDTGRADYWTSALSSLTLSHTHKQEQPLNLSIQRALRAQRSNRRVHPNKLTDHQSVQYVGLELRRPGLNMMKRFCIVLYEAVFWCVQFMTW